MPAANALIHPSSLSEASSHTISHHPCLFFVSHKTLVALWTWRNSFIKKMIIDAKTIVVTLIVAAIALYAGLRCIRQFALQIAQENHDAVLAMDAAAEATRRKKEQAADAAAASAFAKVQPILTTTTTTTTMANKSTTSTTPKSSPTSSSLSV
jgi:hypothetical protein